MFSRIFLILFTLCFTFAVVTLKKSDPKGHSGNLPELTTPVSYMTLMYADNLMSPSSGKFSDLIFFVSDNIIILSKYFLVYTTAVDLRLHQLIYSQSKPKQFHLVI